MYRHKISSNFLELLITFICSQTSKKFYHKNYKKMFNLANLYIWELFYGYPLVLQQTRLCTLKNAPSLNFTVLQIRAYPTTKSRGVEVQKKKLQTATCYKHLLQYDKSR